LKGFLHSLTTRSASEVSKYPETKILERRKIFMKTLSLVALVVLTLVIAAFGQTRSRGPQGGPPGVQGQRPDPSTALKTALNLTEAQVVSLQALQETRRERGEALRTEIEARRSTFEAALSAAVPNATEVGNAAIALRASEKKMQAERDWFIAELKKLLTADQQQTLDNLIASGMPIPGLMGPGGRGARGPRGPRGR
jgi:Spy/CpxP family protein refolding chaperone